MTNRMAEDRPEKPNCVTIFGAGVAGLTAAHELVERGFRVQVWEPTSDPRDPRRGCEVGGLARTQWSRANWQTTPLDVGAPPPRAETPGINTTPIVHLLQKLVIYDPDWEPGELRAGELSSNAGRHDDNLPERVCTLGDLSGGMSIEVLVVGLSALRDHQLREAQALAILSKLTDLTGYEATPLRFEPKAQAYLCELGNSTFLLPLREPGAVHRETTAVVSIWVNGKLQSTAYFVREWQPGRVSALGRYAGDDPSKVITELLDDIEALPEVEHIYVEMTVRANGARAPSDRQRYIQATLRSFGNRGIFPAKANIKSTRDALPGSITTSLWLGERQVNLIFVELSAETGDLPDGAVAKLAFRIRERWLPGEHGHRFFPSFYHHLFDTMQRTPLLETVEKAPTFREQERAAGIDEPSPYRYAETGRTVYDNVEDTSSHALAFEDGSQPRFLSRLPITSLEELLEQLQVFFSPKGKGGFDADPRDVSHFLLKLFQYLTSSGLRRETYEKVSWWSYIEGDSYGPEFRDLLLRWPEALVAMDAKSADARTNGSTTVQILLDLLRPGGYRDGILKGPTNEAWLEHWRRYLEAQGVEFLHGRLKGFVPLQTEAGTVIWPDVANYEPRHPMNAEHQPQLFAGYFVLALSAHEVARVAASYLDACKAAGYDVPEDSDLARAAAIDTSGLFEGKNDRATPLPIASEGNSEFRHYAGIQFYFEEDAFWLDGQIYHPDSEWALTSVSQARFWEDRTDWEYGYRGVLSVIIGNWNAPSRNSGKRAFELPPHQLALEVWRQVERSFSGPPRPTRVGKFARSATPAFGRVPQPVYWHLDESIQYQGNSYYNHSPFHILPPGKWAQLPGDPRRGYRIERGIVLAGMYTRTYTRLPCMETACESARHAVNAILRHCAFSNRCTPCEIYDPELREIDDLAWLKELDERLLRKGLPHVVELYGLDRWVKHALRGGAQDPLDLTALYFKVATLLKRHSKWWRAR